MAINIKTHGYSITRNTSGGRQTPKYIVLHYTATNGATAKNEVDYFGKNPAATNASADFFVDDNEIWQYNTQLDSRYSWAVGDGVNSGGTYSKDCFNTNQISIEMSCTLSGGVWRISEKTYSNAIELTKYLMQKFKIPAERVIRHHDVSRKLCPNAVGWLASTGSDATWKKFKAAISATNTESAAKTDKKVNTPIYRVRKSANDGTSQIGAYAVLANAKHQADEHAAQGYKVFDMSGKLVYEPNSNNSQSAQKKSVSQLADEVIAGKWGNGDDRKKRLEAAGYNYAAVQAAVNAKMR